MPERNRPRMSPGLRRLAGSSSQLVPNPVRTSNASTRLLPTDLHPARLVPGGVLRTVGMLLLVSHFIGQATDR
ncbi:hypothetical protein [Streptomyces sp. BE133]|uniref:hypothetical protein n=1 Tax=Streptomyces sp. BE133 TaxID=3002523 RepID=UPI002E7A4288|nr:hypothetical protein [Streptomyces sp. BE133]